MSPDLQPIRILNNESAAALLAAAAPLAASLPPVHGAPNHAHTAACDEHTTAPGRRSGPNATQLHIADELGNQHAGRLPEWMKVRLSNGAGYSRIRDLVREQNLHTVCQSAACPNMSDCWSRGTATFMILGNVCTRSCGFCAVQTGRPLEIDLDEPRRVAESVALMGLKHAVITSVNRDELPDGGAQLFAETITLIRETTHGATQIEVLIPDFRGETAPLQTVMTARPDVLNHNVETVPRLYTMVRPQARMARSRTSLRQVSVRRTACA